MNSGWSHHVVTPWFGGYCSGASSLLWLSPSLSLNRTIIYKMNVILCWRLETSGWDRKPIREIFYEVINQVRSSIIFSHHTCNLNSSWPTKCLIIKLFLVLLWDHHSWPTPCTTSFTLNLLAFQHCVTQSKSVTHHCGSKIQQSPNFKCKVELTISNWLQELANILWQYCFTFYVREMILCGCPCWTTLAAFSPTWRMCRNKKWFLQEDPPQRFSWSPSIGPQLLWFSAVLSL